VKRDAHISSRDSSNHIEITATSEGLRHYQETFRDTVEHAKLLALLERYYRTYIHELMQHLAAGVLMEEHPQTVEMMTRGVTVNLLGWLDQTLAMYQEITDDGTYDLAVSWLVTKNEFVVKQIDRWWMEAGSFYPRDGAADRLQQAMAAWEEAERTEQLSASLTEESDPLDGAYGLWGLDDVTSFEVAVDMPAEILDTNAHRSDGNRAEWEFHSAYFWLKDYTLTAISACTADVPDGP